MARQEEASDIDPAFQVITNIPVSLHDFSLIMIGLNEHVAINHCAEAGELLQRLLPLFTEAEELIKEEGNEQALAQETSS